MIYFIVLDIKPYLTLLTLFPFFCSIRIVLLGVGSYSLLKVEGEKWIGRIACCYVDQLKMRILGLGVVGLKS